MKRETLSSDAVTFLYRFIFPGLFHLILGFGTVLTWMADFEGKRVPSGLVKWAFLVAWLALLIGQLFVFHSFKRVEVDTSMIYISGFFQKEAVPFNQIESVSERARHSYVEIVFRQDTGGRKKIIFIPSMLVLFRTKQSMSIYLQKIVGIDKSDQ